MEMHGDSDDPLEILESATGGEEDDLLEKFFIADVAIRGGEDIYWMSALWLVPKNQRCEGNRPSFRGLQEGSESMSTPSECHDARAHNRCAEAAEGIKGGKTAHKIEANVQKLMPLEYWRLLYLQA